eukprot:TRINITY_DN384_c0_g1_i1.p1 TRINITY_DN384_c0_g1~~TRINITY_DN384_c0_g1_i1.p1  ORF type:complete len:585 (-),score=186.40 TRINITY_DN384_c0_g1_i1:54-1808(-)
MMRCLLVVLSALAVAAFDNCNDAPQLFSTGSSTVFPIAELYAREQKNIDVLSVVTSAGSTLGFRNLLTGAADIGHGSRALAPKDYDNVDCDASLVNADGTVTGPCQGVLPLCVKVANDVIAVITSPDVTLGPQSLDDIIALFSGSDYTFVVPDKLSGTYDFFIEQTSSDVDANLADIEGFSDDEALISALASATNAIGWVGVGAVTSAVNVVEVEGITPTPTGDVAGYPLFRPLFMCFNDADDVDTDKKNMIKKYMCGILGEEGQKIASDAKYLPLAPAEVSKEFFDLGCIAANALEFDTYTGGEFQDCKDIRSIVVTGSSTVFPITSNSEATCGSDFINIVTGSSGSSVGIATFLAGGNNLAAASRALRGKDYEAFDCDADAIDALGNAGKPCQGKEPKSLIVGRDMLSIIVNPASDLACVTIQDLVSIFIDASEGYTLCGADTQSGTRDFFEEEIGEITDPSFSGFANDEDILDCVVNDVNAIAFVPVAYIADKSDQVNIVNVDGGDSCKSPLTEADAYPLARPLFIVYDALATLTDEQAIDYLCCLLSDDGQKIVESVGYTPLAAVEIANEIKTNGLICVA